MKKFLQEFKQFISKGNVMDLFFVLYHCILYVLLYHLAFEYVLDSRFH